MQSIVGCGRECFTDKRAMRPDLSLYGEAADTRTVIEVVHHNPPSADKLDYYRMRLVTLVLVRVSQDRDLPFRDGVLRAAFASYGCNDPEQPVRY